MSKILIYIHIFDIIQTSVLLTSYAPTTVHKTAFERDPIMETLEIDMLIRSLGISATYRGYRYLSYGIYLCLQDENYLLSVSKLLYPQIAHTFCTTSSSVERDIRTVIKVCWERGNKEYLRELALYPLSERPPASEFIDILVAHLSNQKQP